jgi:hypothetical protein
MIAYLDVNMTCWAICSIWSFAFILKEDGGRFAIPWLVIDLNWFLEGIQNRRLVNHRLWSHENLNDDTHLHVDRFIGGVSMKNLGQLMFTGLNGYVVDDKSQSLLSQENINRLRNIPICFIHGSNNAVYIPESTMTSYDILRNKFESSNYERWVFEKYGHLDCWMGKSAHIDVFPHVEQHIKKTVAALVAHAV